MPNIINKVVYDGQTLIDLTQDTVTAGDVLQGVTVHLANGTVVTGTMIATSTPTANTISKFDANAKMNSTDMSAQDVSDFVDALNVTGINAVDYIVEQGTSGIWTYRKWNSGIAECWGTKDWTISGWTQWTTSGNIYYSNYSGTTAYPTNLFTATPALTVRVGVSTGDCWQGTTSSNSKTQAPDIYALRVGTGSTSITAHGDMHAIGKWK